MQNKRKETQYSHGSQKVVHACLVFAINNCEESSPTINNFHPTHAYTSVPCRNKKLSVIHSFTFS